MIDHPSDTQPQWTMAKNYVSPGPQKTRKKRVHTVCPRGLVHFLYSARALRFISLSVNRDFLKSQERNKIKNDLDLRYLYIPLLIYINIYQGKKKFSTK